MEAGASSAELYPLPLVPLERELIWGGQALVARYGKQAPPGANIGESWECWDENRVGGGALAGKTLAQARAALGARLMGAGGDPARIFPLLTKFIDARAALSVQVHPGNAYAQRVEDQPFGKTESWYVLEAEADASIVLGWNRATSRDEYLERVRDGTLGTLLRHVAVRPGDVFYLPAGTLHAIGAGIVLFETQQASDLTYRIFDYNRLGTDGKPRALNVDKAADVLDYGRSHGGALRGLSYRLGGADITTLVAGGQFVVERVVLSAGEGELPLDGMPLALTALAAAVELRAGGQTVRLEPYRTAVVPAALESVELHAPAEGATLLSGVPSGDRAGLQRRYASAGVARADSAEFFAQFALAPHE